MLNIFCSNKLPHSKGNVCQTYFVPTEASSQSHISSMYMHNNAMLM